MLAAKVIGYDIENNALEPSIKVQALITNNTDKRLVASMVTCDVYFGKYQSPFKKGPYIATSTNVLNTWIKPDGNFEISTMITFTRELIERIDKLKPIEEDLHLTLKHQFQFFTINQESKVEQVYYETTACDFAIKISDWTKLSTMWAKDTALIAVSPQTYERIKELRKIYRNLRSDDDVINELINLHTKQQS